jgi:hypothetical protein
MMGKQYHPNLSKCTQKLTGTKHTSLQLAEFVCKHISPLSSKIINWCGRRGADHVFDGETLTIFFSTLGLFMEDYQMKVPQ